MRLLEAIRTLDQLNTAHRRDAAYAGTSHRFTHADADCTLRTTWVGVRGDDGKPALRVHLTLDLAIDGETETITKPGAYTLAGQGVEEAGLWLRDTLEMATAINDLVTTGREFF